MKVLESPYFDFDLPAGFRLALLEAGVLDDRESGGYASSLWRVRKDELNKILKPVAGKIDRLKRAGAALEASTSWREFRNILQSLVAHFKWPNIKFPEPEPSSAPQRGRPKAKAEAKAEAKADFKGRLGEGAPGKGLERFCGEEAERAIARRDAAAVEAAANAMIGLFDALQESSDAPKASLRNFRLWLDEALGGLSVQDPAQGPPGIEIMGYYDLHGARFDTLFLAGLNDRVFPAPAADPCWWPDAFVEGLAEGWLGRRLWSDAAETYQTREALVAQALGQASKVILSYHLAREDGLPMLPSPLLESLKGLFPEGELKVERPGWPLPPAPSRICDPGELWLSLAQKWPGADPPKIFARFQPSEEEASRLWKSLGVRRARISKRLGELPEAYLSAWLATLERHQGMPLVSLNLLTGYKECQRKFLLERLIGLDRWPVPVEEWEPKEWGDLLHETLEKYLRPAMEGSLKPLTFDCLKFLHWENAHRRSCNRPIGREPVWKAQVAREVRDLEGWFKRQALSKLKLMDLEWSFQPGGDAPPLAIETAVGPLAIQGRVDRLERLDGGIVLTDYKRIRSAYYSGDPGEGENRQIWEYQLVLYSLAVKSHFPAESVTSRIEFINPKDKEPIVEIPPGEPALLGGLWEAVFSRGLAPAAEMDSCQKCEFGALCAGGPQDG